LLRHNPCVAIRRATAARFFVGRVPEDRTWPPLILGFGHSRNQEQNAAGVENRDRSGPTSVSNIWAVKELIPGTAVRSTPNALHRSSPIAAARFSRVFCAAYRLLAVSRLLQLWTEAVTSSALPRNQPLGSVPGNVGRISEIAGARTSVPGGNRRPAIAGRRYPDFHARGGGSFLSPEAGW